MTKKYWLVGGIIGAILTLFYSVELSPQSSIIFEYIYILPVMIAWSITTSHDISENITVYLVFIPYGFLLGALVGWIYGKLKKILFGH